MYSMYHWVEDGCDLQINIECDTRFWMIPTTDNSKSRQQRTLLQIILWNLLFRIPDTTLDLDTKMCGFLNCFYFQILRYMKNIEMTAIPPSYRDFETNFCLYHTKSRTTLDMQFMSNCTSFQSRLFFIFIIFFLLLRFSFEPKFRNIRYLSIQKINYYKENKCALS